MTHSFTHESTASRSMSATSNGARIHRPLTREDVIAINRRVRAQNEARRLSR